MTLFPPISPIHLADDPSHPNGFPIQAPLFKAMFQSAKRANTTPETPKPKSAVKPPETAFTTLDITRLLGKINRKGVTYAELRSYPRGRLTPLQSNIIDYLIQHKRFFDQLARLDKNSATLSPDDIRLAAQLSGDALSLSDSDVAYLREHPVQSASQKDKTSADKALQLEQALRQVVAQYLQAHPPANGTNNPTVSLSQLQGFQPTAGQLASPAQTHALDFIKSPLAERLLQTLGHTNNLNNNQAIMSLVSVAMSPALLQQGRTMMLAPLASQDPLDTVAPISADKKPRLSKDNPFSDVKVETLEQLDISASQLAAIIHRINPTGDAVSLEALRAYHPANKQEETLLQCIAQHNVFKALAGLDHHDDVLNLEDIKIAVSHHMVVLWDAHLSLHLIP
jgi:hypothetical protein